MGIRNRVGGMRVLVAGLCLWAGATEAAAGSGVVRLAAQSTTLAVGKELRVDVAVEESPEIYGADIAVSFDPKVLEVVDGDRNAAGIQISGGSFIDPKASFFLQDRANNEAGTIDYALTLLNPAPAARGKGALAQITFRGKRGGVSEIVVRRAQFGTRAGERLNPDRGRLRLVVTNGTVDAFLRPAAETVRGLLASAAVGRDEQSAGHHRWPYAGVALLAGLALGWLMSHVGRPRAGAVSAQAGTVRDARRT